MSETTTISFRIPVEKVEELAHLAALQDRDRTYVLNEAVDQYLDLNAYHTALIREGLRQADAGELVPHEQVVAEIGEMIAKSKR